LFGIPKRIPVDRFDSVKGGTTMKLIVAIIQDQDYRNLGDALRENNFRSTRISSTGGFLSTGNSTLLIGVEQEHVDAVVELIKTHCLARTQLMNATPTIGGFMGAMPHYPVEVVVGGAIIFVIDADKINLTQVVQPEIPAPTEEQK
jgi:uncharacterized protein YaaQ